MYTYIHTYIHTYIRITCMPHRPRAECRVTVYRGGRDTQDTDFISMQEFKLECSFNVVTSMHGVKLE